MMRGLMERVFAPEQINRIFEENAKIQYTRELLFSSLVELMSLVVCGIHPSVNAAYRAKAQQLNVSRTAIYDKLNGVESFISAAIVRETGVPMASLIEFVGGKSPQLLPGYKVRGTSNYCLGCFFTRARHSAQGTPQSISTTRWFGRSKLVGKGAKRSTSKTPAYPVACQ